MVDADAVDEPNFFRDPDLIADPYPFFDELRSRCPVQREPHENVVLVTGYDEALTVYHDTATFSSCVAVTGPLSENRIPVRMS